MILSTLGLTQIPPNICVGLTCWCRSWALLRWLLAWRRLDGWQRRRQGAKHLSFATVENIPYTLIIYRLFLGATDIRQPAREATHRASQVLDDLGKGCSYYPSIHTPWLWIKYFVYHFSNNLLVNWANKGNYFSDTITMVTITMVIINMTVISSIITSLAIGRLSSAITLPHWRNPMHLPRHCFIHIRVWKCSVQSIVDDILNIFIVLPKQNWSVEKQMSEPGFLRGVVQSLSSWPPPPPKDIWLLCFTSLWILKKEKGFLFQSILDQKSFLFIRKF